MEPSRNNDRARAAARRRAAIRRRRQRQAALMRLCMLLVVVLAILIGVFVLMMPKNPLVQKLTLEAGSALQPKQFLEKPEKYENKPVSFVTDITKLDLTVPGEHTVELSVDGKHYTTVLVIEDLTPPKADPVDSVTEVGVLPDPETLVTNVRDVGPVTISYRNEPDVSKGGEVTADILLTDAAGNTAVVRVKLLVISDEIAPEIHGAADWEVYVGDTIAYKANITVSDDQTQYPTLTVDNSKVDTGKAGTYPVTYTATDAAGNSTSVTVYLTLVDKPAGYVEPEVVYEFAQDVLDEITDSSMSKVEVAAAIYNWVRTHIGWYDHSDKENGWAAGAYDGFTKRMGDCFTYYATAKALFDVAGIPNIGVTKVITADTSRSSHYWSLINLGDGWYHVDITPRNGNYTDSFFLYTDEEMLNYSRQHKNCFNFDVDAYPDRATQSVQEHFEFDKNTLKVTIKESW